MKNFKISASVWNSFNKTEQEFIKQYIHISTLPELKMIIKDTRNQIKNFASFRSLYSVYDKEGNIWFWSGEDTRTFHKKIL